MSPRAATRRALLDVNVLIALLDSNHADHDRARTWLTDNIGAGWASCAITQNGFARIVSQARYPNGIATSRAIGMLRAACDTEHHRFTPCDVSMLDTAVVDGSRVHGPRQLTDVYLLALAVAHDLRFVTFDGSVPLSAVPGATRNHLVVL